MRPIDADVLKEIIGKCPENWTNSPEEIEAFNMWHRIMDDIDSTPTVNDWISVQDKLPEKSGWYLVSLVNTRTGHRWEVPVPADYSHGEWDYAYLGVATWTPDNMVTHWMPRPKPPEVSENG